MCLNSSDETLHFISAASYHNTSTIHTEAPDALSRHLLAISEQEKASLARELHDELGSHLMVMRINLATALEKFGSGNPELANHLQETLQSLKQIVDIKCHIIENLRPSMLADFGLAISIRSYCEEIAYRSGIKIDIEICGDFNQLDSERTIALYRIIQEALTNTIKYANAKHIAISLTQCPNGVRLSITDDGIGITQETLNKPKAHGVLGMRERAVLNGGSFEVSQKKEGTGTHIDVFIPRTPN
jgi:signal transduction histidine kinase